MAFEVENLFQAVDIILEQRLQDVNFDRTIICTIVDDSQKKNGCYVVTDGTIKFNAYVSDATYKKDDQVRVSVLGGDFSEKKFITGKYIGDEDSSPITYKSPLESIVPITGNLVAATQNSDKNGVSGLRANSTTVSKILWQVDLTSNNAFRDLQANGIYNTLTMKADFKTLLSNYDLVSGNYGLRLDLLIQPNFDSPQRIRKYVTLDSSEMLGNPYSFLVYSTQAKKIDIVSTGVIAEMVLWFYQSIDGDNNGSRFIERNGNEIPVNKIYDDILVKNIEIGFGSDIVKVNDNTLEIFTSNSPYYKYKDPTAATNKKDIELLWFNKTEDNEFIGFRDGLFDLNYDEIEYLTKANQDARLLAQMGRTDVPSDEPGLKLAADLKDAKPNMITARDALTRDLNEVLQGLQRQVYSSDSITTELNKLLNTANGVLVTQWDAANTAIENWNSAYVGVLQYAYNKQNQLESTWKSEWDTDYFQVYVNAIDSALQSVKAFFDWLDGVTQPEAAQSAHRGNYDLYWYRASNKIAGIRTILNQLNVLLKNNYTKLIAYKNNSYVFYEYKQKDLSSYNNKYCIYWYRYEKDYKLEYNPEEGANNDEFNHGRFLSDGWRRMEISDGANVFPNFGLPRDESLCLNEKGKPWYKEDGTPVNASAKKYYPPKALAQVVSREMDINLLEEKYMVVLFYNHEMFKSNVLIFTNSEPELIPNESLADQRDALKIEHHVDSQEHYQAYNEYNQLRSLDDGGKIRQLKCSYDGLFQGDEALIDAGLYWYIPNHNTMLTFDKDFLIKEGFSTDAGVEGGTEHSIKGYTYFYKKVGVCAEADKPFDENGEKYDSSEVADRLFFYKIKPTLEKTATNNTILVKAQLKDVDAPVEGDITMTFSTFGTNGTKYTLTLVPATSQAAVIGKDKPLSLQLLLRDSQNNAIDIVDSNNVNDADAYGLKVESWNNFPNAFTVTNIFDDTTPPDYIKGLTVSLTNENIDSWEKDTPYFGIINAKVNFKLPNIENDSNKQSLDNQDSTNIADNEVSEYQKYRVVDLNTLYAVPYSSSTSYYMSGATNIVYNNQGTVSFVSEDEYKLYTVNDKGNKPVENQTWHIEYYDKNGNWINQTHEDWGMLINYMPVLNSKNRLTPAPLYIEGLEYVPVVICTVNGDYAWVQPIIITQNRYASSTLNDWNGSLTIDEKNGTILSTAVGAGKKETDNSFSGVLMGDIGKGFEFDPDNMSGLGIYGFNYGSQSFCLNVDGKAFFGKAGRGRIYIDGDNGTISSASFQQTRNYDEDNNYLGNASAGMMIDLDDGFIYMRGTKTQLDDETGKYYYVPDESEKDDKDRTAQAEILITTGERQEDSTNTSYLKIRSAKQYDPEHYLFYVGSEKYYLQTDNYKEVIYSYTDGAEVRDPNAEDTEENPKAAGIKMDLAEGYFDAYNFRLTSKNIFINSTENNEYEPYFVVRDIQAQEDGSLKGINLFYAGADEYYLKSNDFTSINEETGQGKGIKINLKEYGTDSPTGIEAYNFNLKAGQVAEGKSDYAIILSDKGDPYLQINTAITKNDAVIVVPLVEITKDVQYFQSSNYDEVDKTGIKLSLSDSNGQSYLKAYSGFTLQAYQTGTNGQTMDNYILIDSAASTYPFGVYGSDNMTYKDDQGVEQSVRKSFKVGWNGEIEATGGIFRGTINATGGTFTGNIVVNGTVSGGKISGAEISGGSITIGDNFSVTNAGHLTAASANIGGWEVKDGSSGLSSGNTYVKPNGIGYNNNKFYVDEDGNLFATSATFDTSLVVKSSRSGTSVLSVNSEGDLDVGGKLYVVGSVGINVKPGTDYKLKVQGKVYCGEKLDIGVTQGDGHLNVGANGISTTGILRVTGGPASVRLGDKTLQEWLEEKYVVLTDLSGAQVAYAAEAGYATSAGTADDADWAAESDWADVAGKVSCSTGGGSGNLVTTFQATNNTLYRTSYTVNSLTSSSSDSSLRFKKNIMALKSSDILYQLNPVSYYYNSEIYNSVNKRYGFIAEEVFKLDPELVEMEKENPELCKGIYYNSILTLAVAEIQKLRKELDELKSNFNIK